jgi:DNA-binding GntR family transcriptional regulator
VKIDPNDPRPPFRQAADDLRARIGKGEFAPGQVLPSIRDLAAEYGVAAQTMQNALRVLRDDRVVVSQQGRGLFVRDPSRAAAGTAGTDAERLAAVEAELRTLQDRVAAAEADNADLRALVAGMAGRKGRTTAAGTASPGKGTRT